MSRQTNETSVWKWLAILVGFVFLWSLGRGVAQIEKAYENISRAKERLKEEESKYTELERRREEVQTEDYRERVIRDDLNMQKEGEVVVILPEEETKSPDMVGEEEDKPNWLKWWELVN